MPCKVAIFSFMWYHVTTAQPRFPRRCPSFIGGMNMNQKDLELPGVTMTAALGRSLQVGRQIHRSHLVRHLFGHQRFHHSLFTTIWQGTMLGFPFTMLFHLQQICQKTQKLDLHYNKGLAFNTAQV